MYLSTGLASEVNVCINQGNKFSPTVVSPIPLTIAPNAFALTVRTSGTGSSNDAFRPEQKKLH